MRAASREKRKRLLGGEGSACCKFCEGVQCHGASGSPSSSSALSMAASMWITTGLLPVILAGTWTDMTVNTEYLQGESRVRVGGQRTRGCASHGTKRYSCSSSTPFTVFSTRFTFLHR